MNALIYGYIIDDKESYHHDTTKLSAQRLYGLIPQKKRDYSLDHLAIIHHTITHYLLKKWLKNPQIEEKRI